MYIFTIIFRYIISFIVYFQDADSVVSLNMGTLKLDGHANKLADFLNSSYKTSDVLCDISIVTTDQVLFKVHKNVIAAFSQYFKKEFELLGLPNLLPIGKNYVVSYV